MKEKVDLPCLLVFLVQDFWGFFFFIGLLFSTFLQASVMAMVLVKQLLALDAESM